MLPIIAIVGRPNVGKSTLFNCLTQTKDALVADFPGVTRDRLYGLAASEGRHYMLIDTGGLGEIHNDVASLMADQTQMAIQEADYLLFLVDARAGLTGDDLTIAKSLRATNKPILLVVNKSEGLEDVAASNEFYKLGLGEPLPISSSHRRGIDELMEMVLQRIPVSEDEKVEHLNGIRIAVAGRPNVGKSTLINRMLGEERVVVFDEPGTTRDSIFIPFERHGESYVLIDTAGVRRRRSREEAIEKFSVVKTLQAIESAHVVVLVIDAQTGVTEQDLHVLGFVLEAGRALVIAVNKWDGLDEDQREQVKRELDRRLVFIDFAEIKFISARHGTGVGELFPLIKVAYQSATKKLVTSELTRVLEDAVAAHQPPLVRGRRIKLRYAHSGGNNPPTIIIHGKQTRHLPNAYQRYLEGAYRKALRLVGTPVRIQFRDSDNPYVE